MADAMPIPYSPYASVEDRALLRRLDLAPGTLPAGGNWYPEERTLEAVVDLIETEAPSRVLMLNGGLAVAVFARALKGRGEILVIDHDAQSIRVTAHMLSQVGACAPVRILEAELQDYDKHNMWYDRVLVSELTGTFDLIFIDGPPHFSGRMPRWPAGAELFHRLAPGGIVVLDKARRVKEKKALQRWAEAHPHLSQSRLKRGGGAVVLRAASQD
ncbi:MAG: class I SAM-dependent methyltransferase [Pseudomonadota bacterium]